MAADEQAPAHRPHVVPLSSLVATNSLVGRQEDISQVEKLLAAFRLVTLTGPPGVGKSRLAAATAVVIADEAHSVHIVDLAEVTDPSCVAVAVAASLALSQTPAFDGPVEALLTGLSGRPCLLVLDHCDPAVTGCAEMTDALLRGCPELRVLATSRERLAVAGEHTFEVPPLAVPEADAPTDEQSLAGYDGVRLFVERACETRSSFTLTGDVAPAVAEICRRLDGLPLAIELAAARIGVLSPPELAAGLDHLLRVLTGGPRTAPVRHRSVRAAIDWSHRLLNDPQQALLRRLAVFSGGCTLDAAGHVCAGVPIEADEVFELMASLVAKSLVVCDTSGPQARYRLLGTIGEYAAERLEEAGETGARCQAHTDWCVALAEHAEDHLAGDGQQPWLERLDDEHDNLRGALKRATTEGDGEAALRLAGALALFWQVRGHYSEGRQWLETALAAGPAAPRSLRAEALRGLGLVAGMVRQDDVAASVEESLELARELDDAPGEARSRAALSTLRLWPDPLGTLPHLEAAIEVARHAGDSWALVDGLALCGRALMWRSQVDRARSLFEECLEVARGAGNERGVARGLLGLGWAAIRLPDDQTAQALLGEGLAVARRIGAVNEIAEALSFLGELARQRGDHATAKQLLDECEGIARSGGSPVLLTRALVGQGRLALACGDSHAALPLLEEAASLARQARLQFLLARCLVCLAGATATLGTGTAKARQLAREAFSAAEDHHDTHGAALAVEMLGHLSELDGDLREAASRYAQVLRLRAEIRDLAGLVGTFGLMAGVASQQGHWTYAVRLWAAAHHLRRPDAPPSIPGDLAPPIADTRRRLGPEKFDAAWQEGTGASWERLVAYACRGHGPRTLASEGWEALTPTEREVIELARQGLNNAEIGERLFVSTRTVGNHLYRVYRKLRISSRRDLRWLQPPDGTPPASG